jgi:hypothetical protein
MTSVILLNSFVDETQNENKFVYNSNNDQQVYNLLRLTIKDSVERLIDTRLPIHLLKCGCLLQRYPEDVCMCYARYEIIGMFEDKKSFACGKHLKMVLKTFLFPGLTIIYQGKYRCEINTPLPYYYPSKISFINNINQYITNRALKVPSFDVLDVFSKLISVQNSLLNPPLNYVYLTNKKYNDDEICSICHETMINTDSGILKGCLHQFHVHCMQKLINFNKKNCPLCRQDIVFENIT